MEATLPAGWMNYIFGGLVAALMWVVRGYAGDVKKIKGSYMTRAEIHAAITAQQEVTNTLFANHQTATALSFAELRAAGDGRQTETTANFRELRVRLDALNDTLLKVAMK